MPSLGASFGRGAATTFQQDLANSDFILIMGSDMAEAHPVGFRWPMKAKEKGAKLIHVDPRFTRTSAQSDIYVQIRAGSDIAFLGGLVNYVLTHDRWFKDYVLHYTNATVLIDEDFKDAEDLEGVFSGLNREGKAYDKITGGWSYDVDDKDAKSLEHSPQIAGQAADTHSRQGVGFYFNPSPGMEGKAYTIRKDKTLSNPRCVLNVLRHHYARYTPAMVADACGCTVDQFNEVAETICNNSGPDRTGAVVYAVGWTQHSMGVQIIRTAAVLQLLLGNVGRPGGGVMALRGHSSIQGSTDIPTLYNLLPGYLPQPRAQRHESLHSYINQEGLPTGYWIHNAAFTVSLLKAWYGDAATKDNEYGFNWIPRIETDYSQLAYFDRMSKGGVSGYFVFGQNPAGGGPNAGLHRAGLRQLDWLVVLDWFETETASYWYADPDGPAPSEIKTEVFFIPSATIPEKEGSFTNTQRLLQWHDKAIDPPEDCRTDAWFVYNLGKRMKSLYAGSTDPKDQGLLNLTWDYDFDETPILPDGRPSKIEGDPDVSKVLQEVNGYNLSEIDPKTGKPKLLSGFSELKDDGSTACGCWIYSGVFPEPGRNRARERLRSKDNYLDPNWGFAWPKNRRIMYNRASADPEGKPWSERKRYIEWDADKKQWTGLDVPDFEETKPPDYVPPIGAKGMDAIAGDAPFIMKTDGLGWLFAPSGNNDGPFPTHYEPVESPIANPLYKEQYSPVVRLAEGSLNVIAEACSDDYPIIACTFRLTEHYLSGPMSRFNSWLNELQPEMFAEISPELAREYGITHGGWMTIATPRAEIEARAMVTNRLKPLKIMGRTIHQIGLPFHWGYSGEVVGGIANDLTSIVLDPNVSIHEAKVFTCRVNAGRRKGNVAKASAPAPWPTRHPVPDTPQSAQPEGHFR